MFNKKKKNQKPITQAQLSLYNSSIAQFIHSNKNNNSNTTINKISSHSLTIINNCHFDRMKQSFTSLLFTQMLQSLNNIVNHNLYNSKTNQSLYTIMLSPQLTEQYNQFDKFKLVMNNQLIHILSNKPKIKYIKSKTFFKKNSYSKDNNSSKGLIAASVINDHLSSDDLSRYPYRDKDNREKDNDGFDSGIFEIKTIDLSNNRNTNRSISAIKELEEDNNNNNKAIEGVLLKKQITRTSKANQSNTKRIEYSNHVRKQSMMDLPIGLNPQITFKDNYIKKHINVYNGDYNDFNKHEYSIMNYLKENNTNPPLSNSTSNKRNNQPRKAIKKKKNAFRFNLKTNPTEPNEPKLNRLKSSEMLLLSKSIQKPCKVIKQQKIQQTLENCKGKFIELFDQYIGFDQSYKVKIFHHKKVYSQQYTPTQRNLAHMIEPYESKENKHKHKGSCGKPIETVPNIINNDNVSIITKTQSSEVSALI